MILLLAGSILFASSYWSPTIQGLPSAPAQEEEEEQVTCVESAYLPGEGILLAWRATVNDATRFKIGQDQYNSDGDSSGYRPVNLQPIQDPEGPQNGEWRFTAVDTKVAADTRYGYRVAILAVDGVTEIDAGETDAPYVGGENPAEIICQIGMPTRTPTPVPTATPTPTQTPTPTDTPTRTPFPVWTATATPTFTATFTPVPPPYPTNTPYPSPTPTDTPLPTPVPPTDTPTPTFTPSPTYTPFLATPTPIGGAFYNPGDNTWNAPETPTPFGYSPFSYNSPLPTETPFGYSSFDYNSPLPTETPFGMVAAFPEATAPPFGMMPPFESVAPAADNPAWQEELTPPAEQPQPAEFSDPAAEHLSPAEAEESVTEAGETLPALHYQMLPEIRSEYRQEALPVETTSVLRTALFAIGGLALLSAFLFLAGALAMLVSRKQ
jgi:hypothetical protein